MEETVAVISKINAPSGVKEDKVYWQHHTQAQVASGLSKAAYCKLNQVHCDRFVYWSNKFNKSSSSLMAVKLKSPMQQHQSHTLCTLTFTNGSSLQIHDTQALSLILEKLY